MWESMLVGAMAVVVVAFVVLEVASGFMVFLLEQEDRAMRDRSAGYRRGSDSMQFVCACSGDEFVGDYNFAVIEMPEVYIEWLCKKLDASKAIAKEESDFYAVEYFDCQTEYYAALPPGIDPADGNFVRVEDDFMSDQEPLPVSALTVNIMFEAIIWRGYPKHGGGQFETSVMKEDFLRDLQQKESEASAEATSPVWTPKRRKPRGRRGH